MPYAILAVIVLCLGVLLAAVGPRVLGPRATGERAPRGDLAAQEAATMAEVARTLSREELAQRLKALSASPDPVLQNERGAMCYRAAAPPTTADYVCPKCGQRTHHKNDRATARLVLRELPAMRGLVKALPGLDARLDESQFCKQCSPGVEAPQAVLVLRFPGVPDEHRVAGVSTADLRLLQEFLAGEKVHKGERDSESALKAHAGRLEELLGLRTVAR
ncbi:MAG TPA: hypothetical protein PK668_01125 [Myxococcota bacterium]|nr:hypothetical protein [Myxococcota bacterium]HRY96703.1 hypothetical protein [Myxococcota bacterium]HSA20209.1 hypothetical protein [Myxococcota bacterium]